MIARLTCCLQGMCCTSWTAHFKEIPGQAEGQAVARGEQMHLLHIWSSLVSWSLKPVNVFQGPDVPWKHTFRLRNVELIYKFNCILIKLLFSSIYFLDFCAYFTQGSWTLNANKNQNQRQRAALSESVIQISVKAWKCRRFFLANHMLVLSRPSYP